MDELWEDDVGDEELLQVEITCGFQGKLHHQILTDKFFLKLQTELIIMRIKSDSAVATQTLPGSGYRLTAGYDRLNVTY